MNFQEILMVLHSCTEPTRWVGKRTMTQALKDCGRVDWVASFLCTLADLPLPESKKLIGVCLKLVEDNYEDLLDLSSLKSCVKGKTNKKALGKLARQLDNERNRLEDLYYHRNSRPTWEEIMYVIKDGAIHLNLVIEPDEDEMENFCVGIVHKDGSKRHNYNETPGTALDSLLSLLPEEDVKEFRDSYKKKYPNGV